MSTAATSANAIQNLIYRAVNWALVADNTATTPATVVDIALHVGAPSTSAQTTNEATYTSYARVTVARSAAGWSAASAGALSNLALIQFPESTGGSNVIDYVSVGINGTIIHYGALSASRTITSGIQPQFAIAALVSTQT